MKGKDIILCLCYMGNTEGTGITSTTPENTEELSGWLQDQFGVDDEGSVEGEIETDTDYVYSYDDMLIKPVGSLGEVIMYDAVVTVGETPIYLYKVE